MVSDNYYEKCYLVDVDKTLCKEGTEEELTPGIFTTINNYYDQGYQVWLFTSREDTGEWIERLRHNGLKFHGVIHKPLAESYVIFDDKLVQASKWVE